MNIDVMPLLLGLPWPLLFFVALICLYPVVLVARALYMIFSDPWRRI